MKITFSVYKKLMSEKQKSIWEKSIKVLGEENEKRFYNTLIEMCKVYSIKKIVPGSEEFLVAKTYMEKVIKSEKYLKESVQAGDISGVSPSLGSNPIYPSSYFSKKPVFGVDLKTIEKFLLPKDETKKDDKKKIKNKMKNKWINFLVDENENEDLKMALIGVKKEGFYLNYGKLMVEYSDNTEKKTLNELDDNENLEKFLMDYTVKEIEKIAGDENLEININPYQKRWIDIHGSELGILRLYYGLRDIVENMIITNFDNNFSLEIDGFTSDWENKITNLYNDGELK